MNRTLGSMTVIMAMVGILQPAIGDQNEQEEIASLRASLQTCCAALPSDGYTGRLDYLMEFGLPNAVKPSLHMLGMAISNCAATAYGSFPQIATNDMERLMFLASAWRLGDDYYLDCLSRNIGLAQAGEISSAELRWFLMGHRNRHLWYILAAQYNRPGISNIVQRLIAYTGETNKYEKVLSGEAKTEYLLLEEFMQNGPESTIE